MTVNSYRQTHTSLHIYYFEIQGEKNETEKNKYYNAYITGMTINSYTHTHTIPKQNNNKNLNRKETSIRISDIIYNLYIRGITINSYTHTHSLSSLHVVFQKRKQPETENKQVLQSVISFTIHIQQA